MTAPDRARLAAALPRVRSFRDGKERFPLDSGSTETNRAMDTVIEAAEGVVEDSSLAPREARSDERHTPAPTADSVERQWRNYCVIEVMVRNLNVDEFVREKEREIEGLWERIRSIAHQTDPEWSRKLARQFIAEREI